MTIPKKLEEKRDELARDYQSDDSREKRGPANSYKEGFNGCAKLLLPEINQLFISEIQRLVQFTQNP